MHMNEGLIGKKYGRLTVIGYNQLSKKYICHCECFNFHEVNKYNLIHGLIRSCGCLALEGNNTKHGGQGTRLYGIWKSMRERCNTPSCSSYEHYGGKGIKVCSEWDNYQVFQSWAIQNGYRDDLTIDRIDYKGDYCPENCRWATYKEQANNTSSNYLITYNNQTKTQAQWAEEYGISKPALCYRLKHNWPIEKALTTPTKSCNSSN